MSNPSSLDDIAFLQSPLAQDALNELKDQAITDTNMLQFLMRLRQRFDAHQAGLLVTQAQLRVRAFDKFGSDVQHMLFDTQALEQASHPLVRHYRAERIVQQYQPRSILDAGCGIGADASTFSANVGIQIVAFDKDRIRIAIAAHNANQLGQKIHFAVRDIREPLSDNYDVIFFDPARRTADNKRIFNVEAYQPPLSLVRSWQQVHPHTQVVVKLAPGVQDDQLDGYSGVLEFISVAGEMKETVLWLGTSAHLHRRATLLRNGEAPIHFEIDNSSLTEDSLEANLSEPRQWLIEPDPSIIRASLVRDLGRVISATQLHADIAYLTADIEPTNPFVRAWRIRTWLPYNIKQLRHYLRNQGIGRVTVKKRGMSLTPEAFIKDLKLNGKGESCTLIITRMQAQRIIMICDDILVT